MSILSVMGRHGEASGARRNGSLAPVERPDAIAPLRTAARDARAMRGVRAHLESLALTLRCTSVSLAIASHDCANDCVAPDQDAEEELLRVDDHPSNGEVVTLREVMCVAGIGNGVGVRFERDASMPWSTREREVARGGVNALSLQLECLVEHCAAAEEVQRLSFANDLSQALADVRALDDAIDIVLAAVCSATNWPYAEAWLPDPSGKILRRAHRLVREQGLERFALATSNTRLARGRGVPGEAWSQGRVVLEPNFSASLRDPRARTAKACGLGAAVAIPVQGARETVAILSFLAHDAGDIDAHLVAMIAPVLNALGTTLNRARADAAVQATDRSQRVLLETLAQYVITTDARGRIASCNDAFLRVVGESREDVLGANFLERYTREPRRERLRVWRAVSNGLMEPIELAMCGADGGLRTVRWHGVVLYGQDGTPIGMTSFGTDTAATPGTGPGRAILADSIDGTEEAILLIDEVQKVTWVNKRFTTLLDLRRDEVMGVTVRELSQRFPLHESIRDLVELCDVGVRAQRDHARVFEDGRHRCLRTTFDPVRDGRGHVMHYLVSLRDVTDERARQRSLQRLSTAVRTLSEGIAITDANGEYSLVNEAFAALHGFTSVHDLRGRSWSSSLARSVPEGFVAELERSLSRHGTWTGDVPLRRNDGSEVVARYAMTALDDDGIVIAAHDQTARIRAEHELVRARDMAEATTRAQANFVSVVSHELRTPLNAIIGFSNIVMKRSHERLDDKDRDYLGRVRASGKTLLSIVDAILTHARAESGNLKLERQRVDVAALLQDVACLSEGLRHAPSVTLRVDLAEGLAPANVDPLRLTQVVTNLVSNALKFTQEGEVVLTLAAEADGAQVITVRDTGIGIPADRLDAIWTPFEQAEAGTARRFGGTGLGLPIVRSLALLMALQLDVSSREGEGSTFSVRIPAEWVFAESESEIGEKCHQS